MERCWAQAVRMHVCHERPVVAAFKRMARWPSDEKKCDPSVGDVADHVERRVAEARRSIKVRC